MNATFSIEDDTKPHFGPGGLLGRSLLDLSGGALSDEEEYLASKSNDPSLFPSGSILWAIHLLPAPLLFLLEASASLYPPRLLWNENLCALPTFITSR